MEYQSPLSMLYHWEKTSPDKVYLKQPIDDAWHNWTWKQTAREVRIMAATLRALHLPPNSHVAMISKNCAHWIIADLAIMMAGHVSIPLYPNLQAITIRQILEHSESKFLLAGKLDDWEGMKPGVPEDVKTISFPFCENSGCESWASFTNNIQPLEENIDRKENELCSIVYTSGTTGMPKGVMFNFGCFAFVGQQASAHLGFTHSERFFSYLPLSHIAERMLVEICSIYIGGQVSFAESLQKFALNLAETQPTVFLGVHRIWAKFQQSILAKLPQKKLNRLLKIPVLSSIIKKKIRKKLGLNKATNIFTGAAPTPVSLIQWFDTLGIKIQEAYAMTENCCYSHVTLRNRIRIGFAGQPLPECSVRLGENNEIQTKHRAMMLGYYKNSELTREVFTDDGFLKTGDEGYIDEEGFLKIMGRVKDIFKTAKGKYVAPSPIEMKFSGHEVLDQVCVVGSGLQQPLALITLSEIGRKRNAEETGANLLILLTGINADLDAHEKLFKIVVVNDEWTVENNLLTPSFKIKRHEIEKKYAAYYDVWTNTDDVVAWHR